MTLLKNVLVILVISTNSAFSKKLPKSLEHLRCSKSQKDFEDCFVKNGNIAIPLIINGIPEYNIPKLNPMEISSIELISTPSLSVNLTNIKVLGLENMKLQKAKLSVEQGRYVHVLKGDNITVEGDYVADGKVLIMPIKGKGHFAVSLKNGIYEFTNLAEPYKKNEDFYWRVLRSDLKCTFDKITFNFENVFDGNKELGDKINQFLNENWDVLLIDFGPGIKKTVLRIYRRIFDEFCQEVPIKNFFLE